MSEPFQVNLSRASSGQSWGFRLAGGIDFSTPLSIQSVTPGSISDQCGLKAGDTVLQIGSRPSDELPHDEAKRQILMAGDNFSMIIKRGSMNIWKPKVTPMSELRGDPQYPPPTSGEEQYVQRTSLAADKSQAPEINFYNRSARPFTGFGAVASVPPPESAKVPVVMNAQYNTPMGMYSTSSALEAFESQSASLVGEMDGGYDQQQPQGYGAPASAPAQQQPSGMRSVRAPTGPPANVQVQQAQHMTCKVCGSLIIGVFVKVKGEPMHAECYKCVGCGKNLKNQGFFTVEGQMHCEPCATSATQPPGQNMVATAVYR